MLLPLSWSPSSARWKHLHALGLASAGCKTYRNQAGMELGASWPAFEGTVGRKNRHR